MMASATPLAWSSDSLSFFNNWFVTGDYAVAGVGLRATGTGGFATGTIKMTGVPSGAAPIAAFLYWSTQEPTSTPGASIGYFNGFKIQGAAMGNPQSPAPGCSSSGTASGFAFVYRADVLRYLPVDRNNVSQANGSQTVKLTDAGANLNGSGINTNGASLVVIYKIVQPGLPYIAPLRAVVIYNGAYTMNKQSAAMTQTVAGFYQAASNDSARMTGIAGNGQKKFTSPLAVNGQTIDTDPFVGAQGANWDNPSYNLNLPTNASSFSVMATASSSTCVTWAAIVASTNVTDSDSDGLLDLWETKGLHRNTSVSPATFGTCSDYPSEPCVNLPAMGANPNKKDVFVQIDWMHGRGDGTGGTDGAGTHDHIPLLAALNSVASVFAGNGINLHFDVGNNYQGNQSTCGNTLCSFIVPAAYSGGGADIDESTLVCHSTASHTCNYDVPYPVHSFEFGFASVRDGNKLIGIPAHFAQNRKDIFHYALFAHALAGPFDVNGHPVDPFTGQPSSTPLSYSGIAHRPGGGFMVTLGLWRSDIPANDQVGSVQIQAGTLMHELGHNLGLGHAGLNTQPNCMPNYPSVMNYLYQTRGLTDSSGLEQINYSYGALLPVSENFLSSAIPMGLLPGLQKYRVRYYGPLAPNQPSTQASQRHCDGTPIKGGEPFEVRLESPGISTPDWSNGTVPAGHLLSADVNYDGTKGQLFADQPDWFVLNLQQIGTGYSFGGLSVGTFATDGGTYATDGGTFATDAGSLATQAGTFATDGGTFATDAGTFATDGGTFATDGGTFATDGGTFATDAGEIDEITVLLSSVDSPPPPAIDPNHMINWSPPSVGNIASYNIYRCAGAGCTPAAPVFKNVTGGTASPTFNDVVNDFSDAGATCPALSTCYNTTYVYVVTSLTLVNGSLVESLFSAPVSGEVMHLFVAANGQSTTYGATTLPFAAPTFNIYGDTVTPLTGVTCSYSSTPRNAGTYTITCTGPNQTSPTVGVTYLSGTASYLGHTQGSLVIAQKPITVTAAASSKTYNGLLDSPATPASPAGSLVYGDTPNFIETYDNPNVGNTHTVTPSGTANDTNGGNNYKVTFVPITTGIIIPAPLTATITGSQTYGGTALLYTPSDTGLVNNETPSVVSGTLTCSTNATATSPVGSYTISNCSGLTASNYTISYSYGALTVNPAPLTATISGSQTYGGTNRVFSAGYSGFVNGQNSSVVSGTPSCTVSTPLGVGSYGNALTACGGLTAANYAISYAFGNFTVSPAPLIATVTGSQFYGGASTVFMVSGYSGFAYTDGVGVVNGSLAGCGVTPGQNVGNYADAISGCTGLSATNYSITYASGSFTVNPVPQSISFGPLSNLPLTSPDFALTATASSGLPVTFGTSSTSCSVAGSTVHLISAGNCSITASQAGGGNYLPATSVPQSFTITSAFVITDFTTLSQKASVPNLPVASASTLTLSNFTSQTSAAWYPSKQTVGNGFTTQFTFSISAISGRPDRRWICVRDPEQLCWNRRIGNARARRIYRIPGSDQQPRGGVRYLP